MKKPRLNAAVAPVRGGGLRQALRSILGSRRLSVGGDGLPPERDRLLFEALEQRVLLSSDPLPAFVVASVNGTIDVPGETDTYTFTLDEPARVVFDSLTNNSQLNWSLSGPIGSLVASRAFSQSDSAEFSSSPVLNLDPGQYTLSVDGSGDATGGYGFRLLDLDKGTELTPGVARDPVTAPANETRVYTFHGNSGDRFFLDVTSRSGGDIYWRLLDPFGQQVFGPTAMNGPSQDLELAPLPLTGQYTLLIEGRIQQSGTASYAFTLHAIEDLVTVLPLNERVDGSWDILARVRCTSSAWRRLGWRCLTRSRTATVSGGRWRGRWGRW
jgi:hypothetical protein